MMNDIGDTYCIVCGDRGHLLYPAQPDRLHQHPGNWDIYQCDNCKLCWIYPWPSDEEITNFYSNYHTHGTNNFHTSLFQYLMTTIIISRKIFQHKFIKALLSKRKYWPRMFKSLWEYLTAYLGTPQRNSNVLMDIGAGNGWFVHLMRDIGWNASGIELDLQAVEYATNVARVPVAVMTIDKAVVVSEKWDVVTMRHVIEHLDNPYHVLRLVFHHLNPGGKLVIICPNSGSLGSKTFGQFWRGLEVPRHLFLYNPDNLRQLIKSSGKWEVEFVGTTRNNAWWFYIESIRDQYPNRARIRILFESLVFHWRERRVCEKDWAKGEEIVLIARKPSQHG